MELKDNMKIKASAQTEITLILKQNQFIMTAIKINIINIL